MIEEGEGRAVLEEAVRRVLGEKYLPRFSLRRIRRFFRECWEVRFDDRVLLRFPCRKSPEAFYGKLLLKLLEIEVPLSDIPPPVNP